MLGKVLLGIGGAFAITGCTVCNGSLAPQRKDRAPEGDQWQVVGY